MKSAGMALGHRGPHNTRRRETKVGPTGEFAGVTRSRDRQAGCAMPGGRAAPLAHLSLAGPVGAAAAPC